MIRYSGLLADNLRDVAADLRTVDLVDLVSYIRFGSYATLEDLVHSSTEFFFRPGTLSFGWNAGVDLVWGEPPTITMAMEFRHAALSVFFDLTLRAADESVKVRAVLCDAPTADDADEGRRLEAALADARLPRRLPPPVTRALDLRRDTDG